MAEWDERSVGFKDERRDRFGERPGFVVVGARRRKKPGRIFRQEIAIEKIEVNDYSVAGFGLESRGLDEGDGKLVVVWRGVAERFFSPPDYFERMNLEKPSALVAGKVSDPLEFVRIKLREREDETERDPGFAQEGEPVLHRFEGARGAAHAVMRFRLAIETDRHETRAGVAPPTNAAFIQEHSVGGH